MLAFGQRGNKVILIVNLTLHHVHVLHDYNKKLKFKR